MPDEVSKFKEAMIDKGTRLEEEWKEKLKAYTKAFPDLARQFNTMQNCELPEGWEDIIPTFPADAKGLATRESNNKIINPIADKIPWFMGGSADLGPSTKTYIKETTSFSKEDYGGRNLHFGVREHAMGAIINGMSLSKIRPYGATFFVFFRLCASCNPLIFFDEAACDLYFYSRQYWCWRGRADTSACRTSCFVTCNA